MIDFIFTLDYELYGNGTGSLKNLVFEPGEIVLSIFRKWNVRFVVFVEVAELSRIEATGTDSAIADVKRQIRQFYDEGFEIGLHLHPQWFNAHHKTGTWVLDYNEYNLCCLPRKRISEIVDESLSYLQGAVGAATFTPLSFRAGNWLFQPTETAASVLRDKGIQIDSSVFKGGLQRNHILDYRPALKNGYYWTFEQDVNVPDATGRWLEVPIYTDMVPFWKMTTSKRLGFSAKASMSTQTGKRLNRALDFMRFKYPRKLDLCRMTLTELTSTFERLLREDQQSPSQYRPIVAIGHTKDLTDPQTLDGFLSFLHSKQVSISTFESARPKLLPADGQLASARY